MLPVGAKLNRTFGCWRPELRGQYIANLCDVVSDYDVWTVGSPVSALMSGAIADRHAGDVGAGLGWDCGPWAVRGDFGYLFSERHRNLYAALGASVRF